MTKMKLRSFTLLAILALSMMLAACSASDSDEASVQESGKKTLIFGHGGDSASLDPARMMEGQFFGVNANLYETLVNLDEHNTIVPGLAEEWESADDGLTYTFTLRKDVKFHDGTEFNAEAVVKNFERWADGETNEFPYYGSVFGGEESRIIESVVAEGDDTVIITLKQAQPSFLKNLTMIMFAMVSPVAFEQDDEQFEEKSMGTGPFQFGEADLNGTVTIVRFEEYWQENSPILNKVIFKSIPNHTARLNALIAGDIDLADSLDPADRAKVGAEVELQFFDRPVMAEAIYEAAPSIPSADSTPLLGAITDLLNFTPQPTGFDVLSKVEFKIPVIEIEEE